MFDGLREKWRKNREKKAALAAVNKAIPTDDPLRVKKALEGLKNIELTFEDKSDLVKTAINNLTEPVFKEVFAFVNEPNIDVKNTVRKGDNYVTYTYTPLGYAVMVKATHDISLNLANDPRVRVSGEIMDSAKSHGMQDVAIVLTKRLADMRRQEAAELDKEAGSEPVAVTIAAAPAVQAPANENDLWAIMGASTVAHVVSSPVINRKITEVFNFESRERVQITENLKTGAESIGQPESFDKIAPATIQKAQEMLKALSSPDAPKRQFSL